MACNADFLLVTALRVVHRLFPGLVTGNGHNLLYGAVSLSARAMAAFLRYPWALYSLAPICAVASMIMLPREYWPYSQNPVA